MSEPRFILACVFALALILFASVADEEGITVCDILYGDCK